MNKTAASTHTHTVQRLKTCNVQKMELMWSYSMTGKNCQVRLERQCEKASLNITSVIRISSAPTVTHKLLHLAWTPENEHT